MKNIADSEGLAGLLLAIAVLVGIGEVVWQAWLYFQT